MSICACGPALCCPEVPGDTAAVSEGSCHWHFTSQSSPVAPNHVRRSTAWSPLWWGRNLTNVQLPARGGLEPLAGAQRTELSILPLPVGQRSAPPVHPQHADPSLHAKTHRFPYRCNRPDAADPAGASPRAVPSATSLTPRALLSCCLPDPGTGLPGETGLLPALGGWVLLSLWLKSQRCHFLVV